jgi:hypothetical protein
MKISANVVSVVSLLSAASVVAVVGGTRTVQAATTCKAVKGTYVTNYTTTNCESPIGDCYAGTITGGGTLNGTTFLSLSNTAPSAGMPTGEPADTASYDGSLVITTKNGTLTLHALGLLESNFNAFSEIDNQTAGTGDFAGTTNLVYVYGTVSNNNETLTGTIVGDVCTE